MEATRREVEIVESPQRQTVAIRGTLPMSDLDIGALFDEYATRLVTYVESRDIEPAGPPYARYRQFGPEQADIEVGFPVDGDLDDIGDLKADAVIGASELPGGRVARLVHSGPYDGLAAAYQRLEGYLAETGAEVAGAPWETYLIMPDAVGGNDEMLQTEVSWPIG